VNVPRPDPQNLDAEESVLGAIMLSATPDAGAKIIDALRATGLEPDDFYRPSHGLIYATALALVDRREPTDAVSLADALDGRLDEAGGKERLHELAALVPATANAPHYATIVVKEAQRRRLAESVRRLQAALQNGALTDDLREEARRSLEPRRTRRAESVEFLTVEEFVARVEPQAEPLAIDADGGTVLPATGLAMVYGTGGAGKTTLWLDAAMHLTAGIDWLDGCVRPVRKLRVGWIENEGPREEFRRKLERKHAAWRGRIKRGRLLVFDRPWSKFDLRRDEHRSELARVVAEHDLDLLIVGPLHRLGMQGGGTPDEVRAFTALIEAVQERCPRPVLFVVIHHDNRAGQVSGAWEGVPDLLVHVQGRGHGRLRVLWQKARWSAALHATGLDLIWAEGEGFQQAEAEQSRPERVWDNIAAYVLEHGGCAWNEVAEAVSGERKYLMRRRDAMLTEGLIVNAGTASRFQLWHRDDPARPTIEATDSEHRTDAEPIGSALGGGGESGPVRRFGPVRTDPRTGEPLSAPPDAAEEEAGH
jgi:hypothetical protein